MIRDYLLRWGRTPMTALVSRESPYHSLVKYHDRLGWDNFVEGRICKIWLQAREEDIEEKNLRTTPDFWERGLMRWLLQLTHRQWLYRNMAVHYKVEGLTRVQHESVMSRIEDMIYVDPIDLLLEHRSLLEVDFDELADSPAEDKQLWLAEMDSPIGGGQITWFVDRVKRSTRATQLDHGLGWIGSGRVWQWTQREISGGVDADKETGRARRCTLVESLPNPCIHHYGRV
jgi:hypothetical protein